LITHPRDLLLATRPAHIVTGADECRARVWHRRPVKLMRSRIDGEAWFELRPLGQDEWSCPLHGATLSKGEHLLEVQATDEHGDRAQNAIAFLVDATGRYTPPPRCRPEVQSTAFC
jgi:3',5'-cyclic-AMP phosphodiesterase